MALPPHALIVVHSDGIGSRWDTRHILPVLRRDPALVAAILMRHHSRKRDDVTIVVIRRIVFSFTGMVLMVVSHARLRRA